MSALGLERRGVGTQRCHPGDWVRVRLDCGDEFAGFVHDRVEQKLVLLHRDAGKALSWPPSSSAGDPGPDDLDDLVIVPLGEIAHMTVWRAYRWVNPWQLGDRRPPVGKRRSRKPDENRW